MPKAVVPVIRYLLLVIGGTGLRIRGLSKGKELRAEGGARKKGEFLVPGSWFRVERKRKKRISTVE
jgi:hypothetical protein